jgi:hypothetical protein
MMKEFYKMVRRRKQIIPVEEMDLLTRVVLAGIESKKKRGIFISLKSIKKYG